MSAKEYNLENTTKVVIIGLATKQHTVQSHQKTEMFLLENGEVSTTTNQAT